MHENLIDLKSRVEMCSWTSMLFMKLSRWSLIINLLNFMKTWANYVQFKMNICLNIHTHPYLILTIHQIFPFCKVPRGTTPSTRIPYAPVRVSSPMLACFWPLDLIHLDPVAKLVFPLFFLFFMFLIHFLPDFNYDFDFIFVNQLDFNLLTY